MLGKYLRTSARRSFESVLCALLDCSFLYEPPAHRLKAFLLNALLGADLSRDCLLASRVRVLNWGNLSVGAGTYISNDVSIRAHQQVRIGRSVTIGPEAFISTGDHSLDDLAPTSAPVWIGDGVFIGARAVVLKGVRIGNHAVIGAGAVVVMDVPELAVCAGVPARIIKLRTMPKQVWTVFGSRDA